MQRARVRLRWMFFAGAVLFATVDVLGVLDGGRFCPAAAVVVVAMLVAGVLAGPTPSPSRWPVALALTPLATDALLSIPDTAAPGGGWQSLVPADLVRYDAWHTFTDGIAVAGAPLLFAAVLVVVLGAGVVVRRAAGDRPVASGPARAAVGVGALVVGYLLWRAATVSSDLMVGGWIAFRRMSPVEAFLRTGVAVLVPFLLVTAAVLLIVLAGWLGRSWVVLGALLLALTALPLVDHALDELPRPSGHAAGQGLFGWQASAAGRDAATVMPALTLGLQFTAYLLIAGGLTRVRRPAPLR